MVKNGSKWGTVCDDRFTEANAQAACSTLGYMGGSFTKYESGLQESKIPILMDEVKCDSSTANFLECPHDSDEDCSHSEDVLIKCDAICLEFSSNCEDCNMCSDADSGYHNSWRGDPVRTAFKFILKYKLF